MATCILWIGCKKQTCDDVTCPVDYLCVDGVCRIACNDNPYLVNDSCGVIICGPHQFVAGDTCLCDTGWTGSNCTLAVSQFAGWYRMYGTEHIMSVGQNYFDTIDKQIEITRVGSELYTENAIRNYSYDEQSSGVSNYYVFSWSANYQNNSTLKFAKGNDSLYYYHTAGGPGGATVTTLSGTKQH